MCHVETTKAVPVWSHWMEVELRIILTHRAAPDVQKFYESVVPVLFNHTPVDPRKCNRDDNP
jgi:hypothetical protein